jgi:hypothetical protein
MIRIILPAWQACSPVVSCLAVSVGLMSADCGDYRQKRYALSSGEMDEIGNSMTGMTRYR